MSGVFWKEDSVTCGVAIIRSMPHDIIRSTSSAEVAESGEPSSTPGIIWQWMSVAKGSLAGSDLRLKKLNIVEELVDSAKLRLFWRKSQQREYLTPVLTFFVDFVHYLEAVILLFQRLHLNLPIL